MIYSSPWEALMALAEVINPVLTGGDELQDAPALVSLTSDVTVDWSLSKPDGSAAVLSAASGTSTSYTTDLDGLYIVTALHSTGGRTTNNVTLAPQVTTPVLTGGDALRSETGLETISSDVTVDFVLTKPSGSSATLTAASGTSTSFTTDLDGYYAVTATHESGGVTITSISVNTAPVSISIPIIVHNILAGTQADMQSIPAGIVTPSWSA